jgi:transposase InsO family protein
MQAAIFGMDYFETYLRGRKFALYTDHKPLCKLSTVHTKTLNRLQLKMTEMYPQIRYVAGEGNTVADFLSRYQGMAASYIDAGPYRVGTLQDGDEEFGPIKEDIKKLDSYDHASKSTKDNKPVKIPGSKNHWRIRNNVLMILAGKPKEGKLENKQYRVVVPKIMRKEFLQEAHNSLLTGHAGQFKTTQRIAATFWWPNIGEHVKQHIQECQTCQSVTDKGKPLPPKRQPLPIPPGPSWRIHVDLFGPNKCADGKKRYVLVMTDAFTKTVALRVLDDKKATTVAQGILHGWCYVYGIPKRIHSDQGLEFNNDLARALWKGLGIEHSTTTPYHPQCNAHAEVFNRTMKGYLATALKDAEKSTLEWEQYIAPLTFAYNTSIHKAAKESPFMTTFGYDPRIPLWDSIQQQEEDQEIAKEDQADAYFKHRHAQVAARKIALNNMQHMQEETQRSTDKNVPHSDVTYEKGDLVWVRIAQTNEANKKFAQSWKPGTIVERTGFSTYKVRREDRTRKKLATLNAQRLKPRTITDGSQEEEEEEEPDADQDQQQPEDDDNAIANDAAYVNISKTNNMNPEDLIDLLNKGWTISGTGPAGIGGGGGHAPAPAPAAPARRDNPRSHPYNIWTYSDHPPPASERPPRTEHVGWKTVYDPRQDADRRLMPPPELRPAAGKTKKTPKPGAFKSVSIWTRRTLTPAGRANAREKLKRHAHTPMQKPSQRPHRGQPNDSMAGPIGPATKRAAHTPMHHPSQRTHHGQANDSLAGPIGPAMKRPAHTPMQGQSQRPHEGQPDDSLMPTTPRQDQQQQPRTPPNSPPGAEEREPEGAHSLGWNKYYNSQMTSYTESEAQYSFTAEELRNYAARSSDLRRQMYDGTQVHSPNAADFRSPQETHGEGGWRAPVSRALGRLSNFLSPGHKDHAPALIDTGAPAHRPRTRQNSGQGSSGGADAQ